MKNSEMQWLKEPARMVGRWVSTLAVIAGAVVALAAQVLPFIPDDWKGTVAAVSGVAGVVVAICAKVQAELTRNGVGPAGNGKDGVYSPYAVLSDPKLPALAGTEPGAVPQGGPQTSAEIEALKKQLGIG